MHDEKRIGLTLTLEILPSLDKRKKEKKNDFPDRPRTLALGFIWLKTYIYRLITINKSKYPKTSTKEKEMVADTRKEELW